MFDDFKKEINPYWIQLLMGGGRLSVKNSILRMSYESSRSNYYTLSQIDDCTVYARKDFRWKLPLRMTVKARFSLPASNLQTKNGFLKGTAGFGFWNNTFSVDGRVHTLPEAIWFFYSAPPSNMKLLPGIPGWGWKAQVVHTARIESFANVLPMAAAIGLNRLTGYSKPGEHLMQHLAGSDEVLINEDITKWHEYKLEWYKNYAKFWVDGKLVLRSKYAPSRPLGFVAWIDNLYAIATPMGIYKFGKVDTSSQWMDLDSIKIEKL